MYMYMTFLILDFTLIVKMLDLYARGPGTQRRQFIVISKMHKDVV